MSKHDLIESFIRGDIDRRQFVSRLTMLGVSGGAALAYAANLASPASAAPAGSTNGFRTRFQVDNDYGTAIEIGVLEALEEQASAIDALVLSLLNDLESFDSDDFPPGVYETLLTIRDHQQQHFDAVSALLEANGGSPGDTGAGTSPSSPDELLTLLSENLDELTARYAAIVPATEDDESRQTMMEAASVASRHAALAGTFSGRNPLPSAFQEPSISTGL